MTPLTLGLPRQPQRNRHLHRHPVEILVGYASGRVQTEASHSTLLAGIPVQNHSASGVGARNHDKIPWPSRRMRKWPTSCPSTSAWRCRARRGLAPKREVPRHPAKPDPAPGRRSRSNLGTLRVTHIWLVLAKLWAISDISDAPNWGIASVRIVAVSTLPGVGATPVRGRPALRTGLYSADVAAAPARSRPFHIRTRPNLAHAARRTLVARSWACGMWATT